jgi:hypothetical protein
MPEYRIYYSITLQGQYYIEASSEAEACEAFDELPRAELVSEAEYCNTDVTIDAIETDASPLEQLAEQAE